MLFLLYGIPPPYDASRMTRGLTPVSFSSKPNHSHAPKGREFGVLKDEAALCIGVAAGLAELPGDYTTA
jgi:hypothetical protein